MFKLLVKILNKLGLLRFMNFEVPYRISGMNFSIPFQGKIGFDILFEKEIWMTIILEKILKIKPDETFVDVGVNLGQTLLKVKSISSDIDYVGFEPNMTCVTYLHKLIATNTLKNVQIFPFGIADKSGPAILYHGVNKQEDSSASIIEEFRNVSDLDQKTIITFSAENLSFLRNITFGVVKIDVEGAELEVLRNLKVNIEKDRPIIICEILPVYNIENSFRLDRQNSILIITNELNYILYRIQNDGALIEVNDIGVHSNVEDCNYLFVPAELKNTFC